MTKYPYLCNTFLVERDKRARQHMEQLIAANLGLRARVLELEAKADREATAVLGSD